MVLLNNIKKYIYCRFRQLRYFFLFVIVHIFSQKGRDIIDDFKNDKIITPTNNNGGKYRWLSLAISIIALLCSIIVPLPR